MSFPIARRRLLLTGAATLGGVPGASPSALAQGRDGDVFEIPKHETATIDGRQWDVALPGGMTVDAAHRSVLLRFPKAADEIVVDMNVICGVGREGVADRLGRGSFGWRKLRKICAA